MSDPEFQSFATDSDVRKMRTRKLVRLFTDTPEGDTLSYSEIVEKCGLNNEDSLDRNAIDRAVRWALREHGIILHCIRTVGYKRTVPSEVAPLLESKLRIEHRRVNRLKVFCSAALSSEYFDRMSKADQNEVTRRAAALGSISMMKTLEKPRSHAPIPADVRLSLPSGIGP